MTCHRVRGRILEERGRGDFRTECLAHPREQAQSEQRIAAQLEEVVVRASAIEMQHVGEQLADLLLLRCRRRAIFLRELRATHVRCRQRTPIELAIGGDRE